MSDPDDYPTMVIPSHIAGVQGDPSRGATRPPAGGQGQGRPKFLMGLVGGAAAMGILGLAALVWFPRGDGRVAVPPPPTTGKADAGGPALEASNSGGGVVAVKPAPPGVIPLPTPTAKLQFLVPAYYYPAGKGLEYWKRLMEDSDRVPIVAIANPNSGPSDLEDPGYRRVIDAAASKKGMKVIGYVNTGYATRPEGDVRSDMDRWVALYPSIQGFFFDQQSPSAQHVKYYSGLNDYARFKLKGKAGLVVVNPGTTCDPVYFTKSVADIICIFASFDGFDQITPPIPAKESESSQTAAFIYQIPDAKAMRQVIEEARYKGISYLYISDTKKGGNPWGRLPEYWDDEVEAVSQAR